MGEKEKLLVISNFSFSHDAFKRLVLQTHKNQGLFGKGLNKIKKSKEEEQPSIHLFVIIIFIIIIIIYISNSYSRGGSNSIVVIIAILNHFYINLLLNDRILDATKLKAFADNKLNILCFSNSSANKDMMSKIWTNGVTII